MWEEKSHQFELGLICFVTFVSQIKRVQYKQRHEREAQLAKQWAKLQEAEKWKILCGQCKSYITRASNIRHINNQVHSVFALYFLSKLLA